MRWVPRWRRWDEPAEQVANAPDSFMPSSRTPVSEAPADAVKAAWEPLLSGQKIPLIGEVRYGEEE